MKNIKENFQNIENIKKANKKLLSLRHYLPKEWFINIEYHPYSNEETLIFSIIEIKDL